MTQPTRQAGIRPARPQREPREGERLWNGHNVDKNLEDVWLVKLNSLKAFDLISICEGHPNGRGPFSASPHLNLRIKENYLPIIVREFDNVSNQLHSSIVQLFGVANTTADLELKVTMNSSRSRQEIRRDLVFHAKARFTRQSIEIESEVVNWFNEVVCNVSQFDDITASLLPVV
ncbi:MAG: hypothetical protein PHC51_14570 [bacterium]|nr:hypothetical protein [bacterium]